MRVKLIVLVNPRLVFHYTSDAGKLSPNATKEMHISTVITPGPLRGIKVLISVCNILGRRDPQ